MVFWGAVDGIGHIGGRQRIAVLSDGHSQAAENEVQPATDDYTVRLFEVAH